MTTTSEAIAAALGHHCAGRLDEAERIYRQVLATQPEQPDAIHWLGVIAHQRGRHEAAIEYIGAAIRLREDNPVFHHNLGEAYRALRRDQEAIACYQRALQLKPDYAQAYNNLGNVLKDQGQTAEAIPYYQQALRLKPDFAEALYNMGNVFREQRQPGAAIPYYRRALQFEPALVEAHNNLGSVLGELGETAEAILCYQRALEINPDSAGIHSNILLTLQYRDGVRRGELAAAHAAYARRHAAPLRQTWQPHKNAPDPERPLRLGFVSPDFACHPVGFLSTGVLENLRGLDCETVCYHTSLREDHLTARFRTAAHTWRDAYALDDERLAEQIRADGVDILFDLSGHTAGNRLLVLARKPAPVQITWLGYEGTTGLEAMDYILADRHVIPEGVESDYRERVLRMPDGYVCYDPPAAAPPAGPLPAADNGHATFGSFNSLAKITPKVIAVWSEILLRTPQSRLVLKDRGLGEESVRRRYLDLFAGRGVEPSRLLLLPFTEYGEYLASHSQVDVALDTFPFSGSATTCDALWMGVAVVTCPGETFASRHGLSHLSAVGLAGEFVARDVEHYVELAVRWATDLGRLAEVRAELRDRMAASTLCDGRRFAANLLRLLRDVWRRWITQS